ncbi:synaptobrevin homolog YKT6 isoform X1 [Strix aluco]|uniref:synaptobrevin homolog YKT6 isoform X1 n=1 Tax=Strix aluco TaxID=111821 RepID=UPI003DA3458E
MSQPGVGKRLAVLARGPVSSIHPGEETGAAAPSRRLARDEPGAILLGSSVADQPKEVMGPISSRGRQPLGWQQDAKGDAQTVGAPQPGSVVPQTLPALSRVLAGVGTGAWPVPGRDPAHQNAEPWLAALGPLPGGRFGVISGTGTPLGTLGLTPGCLALPPGASVLPASCPSLPATSVPSMDLAWQEMPAAPGWGGRQPREDPHHSPHLPCPPTPSPRQPPACPRIAPAAASPSPSCRSPSWLGDPAWGQPSGRGGLRAEPSPPKPPGTPPRCLARGASPLPRPGSRPVGAGLLRPSLRRGMLHFRRFISSTPSSGRLLSSTR